ncbi:MAG: DsrE family protein [Alphaproteobacteria bacterium]|nr:DsrE family protein [Alphaproteobacteria bacterium]
MTGLRYAMGAASACVVALLLVAAPVTAQDRPQLLAQAPAAKKAHRLVMQVNNNDAGTMNLALNNAANVAQYYKEKGEPVEIEIVTYGPGLHMLRDDTSPVKDRIKAAAQKIPGLSFKACGNTQANMRKAEEKDIPLVPEAKVVPSGVVWLSERQEQGWSYVRP